MKNKTNLDIDWTPIQIEAVVKDLVGLRQLVDLELVPRYPYFGNKIYPLGRCKEIRDAVFEQLHTELKQPVSAGLMLIRSALEQGLVLKKIWGALRGVYFQNAITLGNWYLDVSNDTVNPNKPRVEVLPLADSGFAEISSFEQFVLVAQSYWGVKVFRNDICPALAPFMPLIYLREDNTSWLGEANDDMLAMTMKSQFFAAESILSTLPPPPQVLLEKWQSVLSTLKYNDFLHAQGNALGYCQQYRTNHYYVGSHTRDKAVMAYLAMPRAILVDHNTSPYPG